MVRDTVWIRDGRLSSRTPKIGSWITGRAPAPSAPIAIRAVPVAPNKRVRFMAVSSCSLSGADERSSSCRCESDELSHCPRTDTPAAYRPAMLAPRNQSDGPVHPVGCRST
ncbi:Uncharacterised protein [Mycobacteroides abscessus subsp. abscessus]|nr:Uncharacterised protein [Mycobacteroides abscessus subsp. abscessus]